MKKLSEKMKAKFFAESHVHPKCINEGCNNLVVVRDWKNWSFKSECPRCMKARKENCEISGVIIHKKRYCENYDAQLGFRCPVPHDHWEDFQNSLDLDHIDGNHYNNVPSNVKTFCKICHGRKSAVNNDCNNNKKSSRKIE